MLTNKSPFSYLMIVANVLHNHDDCWCMHIEIARGSLSPAPVSINSRTQWLGVTESSDTGLHHIQSIMDCIKSTNTRTLPYPWYWLCYKRRMITTLNRKLLKKQRVQNHFEVDIGHFFYNVNATVSFGNHLNLSNSVLKVFHWTSGQTDKLTKKLTDGQNQLLNPFTHSHAW